MDELQLMKMFEPLYQLKQNVLVVVECEDVGSRLLHKYPTTANRSASMSSKTRYRSSLLSAPSTLNNLMMFGCCILCRICTSRYVRWASILFLNAPNTFLRA